ncbi:hypothetical protein [Shewanella colwelliana]|nr:hypothetical protein [Shewanella colwelliana]
MKALTIDFISPHQGQQSSLKPDPKLSFSANRFQQEYLTNNETEHRGNRVETHLHFLAQAAQ